MKTNEPTQLAAAETEYEIVDRQKIIDEYQEYEDEAEERRARGAVVNPETGKTVWRFMPAIKGTGRIFYRVWTHAVNNGNLSDIIAMFAALPPEIRAGFAKEFGVNDITAINLGEGFKSYLCPSKMEDKDCLTCRVVSALYKLSRSSAALKQAEILAGDIKSKEEFFVGAVRMDKKEEMEKGPRILALKKGLYEKANRIYRSEPTEDELAGDFTHPDTGFNLIIEKKVDDKKKIVLPNGKPISETKYELSPARNVSKLPNREWLKHLHDLTKAREPADDEALRAIMFASPAPAAPSAQVISAASTPRLAAVPPPREREPGDDDDEPAKAVADDGKDPGEWIEDPENPGDFGTRANLRAMGRKV